MASVHVLPGANGRSECRYCRRAFVNETEAEAHIRQLVRMGMLQDHIAIHWTSAAR